MGGLNFLIKLGNIFRMKDRDVRNVESVMEAIYFRVQKCYILLNCLVRFDRLFGNFRKVLEMAILENYNFFEI